MTDALAHAQAYAEGLRLSHEAGRKAGLEQAAAWHDDQARQWGLVAGSMAQAAVERHRAHAAAIRAMMEDKP